MAKRAFIFDLDGVIVDSEPLWDTEKAKLFQELLGPGASEKIGLERGLGMEAIAEDAARKMGVPLTAPLRASFLAGFRAAGDNVYRQAVLAPGTDSLLSVLADEGYAIGLVSAAPGRWIGMTTSRLRLGALIQFVISLEDRTDLAHKPAPDGYREAMAQLGVRPEHTIVLEDSNTGITSARAAGAYTVGFSLHLLDGYVQSGADTYAPHMEAVASIARQFNRPAAD